MKLETQKTGTTAEGDGTQEGGQGEGAGGQGPVDDNDYDYPDLVVPAAPDVEGSRPAVNREDAVLDLLAAGQETNRLMQQRLEAQERQMQALVASLTRGQRAPAASESYDDDGDGRGAGSVTTAEGAAAELAREVRRLRSELANQQVAVQKQIEGVEYGFRRETAEAQIAKAVDDLNAKHGEGVFEDLDIIKVKRANPHLSIEAAARAAEHKRLSVLAKSGYRRQVVVEKGRPPSVPGMYDTASRPAFVPKKRATNLEELRANTEEAIKHSGLDEVLAEANRVRQERLRQMEE